MIFNYSSINKDGVETKGEIDSMSRDLAISELQKRGLVVVSVEEKRTGKINFDTSNIQIGGLFKPKIKQKDLVIFSRQASTLFESGISALRTFRLLSVENESLTMKERLTIVADDIEKGVSMSSALSNQPDLFSSFYVNMVRSGEESGKLKEVFLYLADYLDREYELKQKTKKALTYPIFVIFTFVLVMVVMFVFIIPKMSAMFAEQGASLPTVTKVVLGMSNFMVNNGFYLLVLVVIGGWLLYRYNETEEGKYNIDEFKLKIPVIKNLYQKTFLTRLSDNLNTMLTSGVPIVRSIEITADVVDNLVYKKMLFRVGKKVSDGSLLSKAFYEEDDVPNVLIQMVKIGEETGQLGGILKSLAIFYRREVDNAVDSAISLIEPMMIVGLGLGVGFLVASVLLPMYSLSSAIN